MVDFHPNPEHQRGTLAAMAEAITSAGGAGISLRETTPMAQIGLRGPGTDGVFAEAVNRAFGLDLPAACRFSAGMARQLLWFGPDEWLLIAQNDPPPGLLAALNDALAGRHCQITDLSHNRVRLELSGLHAPEVLAKGCLLDLHDSQFPTGTCVGTTIAGCQVFLLRTGDEPSYEILVRNSFSRHLTAWLIDAMAEFA